MGGGNPFDEILALWQQFIIDLQAGDLVIDGGGVIGAYGIPDEPSLYFLLIIILTLMVFEHRKTVLLLFYILAYFMFGLSGVVVGTFFWIFFVPVNLMFDFFGGDRKF